MPRKTRPEDMTSSMVGPRELVRLRRKGRDRGARGAVAELAHNGYDHSAQFFSVFVLPCPGCNSLVMAGPSKGCLAGSCASTSTGPRLCFRDDGQGMAPDMVTKALSPGFSMNKPHDDAVGMFGEGLKTGVFGIGDSGLVHTACVAPDGTLYLTCALLSLKLNQARALLVRRVTAAALPARSCRLPAIRRSWS